MKVFISYSWADAAIRRALVADLKQVAGLELLYDKAYLRASDQVHHGISKLLDDANIVIAILTKSGVESHEVRDELSRANERRKRIIPLVHTDIGNLDQLPHYLRESLQIRFTDREIDAALDQLVGQLKIETSQQKHSTAESGAVSRSTFAPTTVTDFDAFDINWLQRSNVGRELLEQVIAMCRVFKFSIEAHGHTIPVPVLISPNTFLPDDWTRTFIEGLAAIPREVLDDKTIVEIGVGTGIVPIAMHLMGIRYRKYLGYDIDTLAARVANLNLDFYQISDRAVAYGGGSTFEPERGLIADNEPYADVVIANVPQVPSLSTGPIRDQFDYYYMPVTLRGEDRDVGNAGPLARRANPTTS